MKVLGLLAIVSTATAAALTPVYPASSSLRHKRQTTIGPGGSTLQGGNGNGGSSTTISGSNSGTLPSKLPYFNLTNFVATSNSQTATYSFNLAYYPGQPTSLCTSQESSWSGYFPYTEANCTNDASLSGTTPLNAFRIDPQDDGSLDIYIASIYFDYAQLCSGCVEASNGSISADYVEVTSLRPGSSSTSGQRYTGPKSFSLVTYLA